MKSHVFIGIYLLIALLVFSALPVWAYFSGMQDALLRAIIYVGASGGIGGTIYSIRAFYQNIGGQTFKVNWIWWYIFRPVISVVAGVFGYFLIVGGLMSISNTPDVTFSKGLMFYSTVAFLAGYSFTRFMERVEGIADNIFSKKENKKDTTP